MKRGKLHEKRSLKRILKHAFLQNVFRVTAEGLLTTELLKKGDCLQEFILILYKEKSIPCKFWRGDSLYPA